MSEDVGGTSGDVVRENADAYRKEMIKYGLGSVFGAVVLFFAVRIILKGGLDGILEWLILVGISSLLLAFGGGWLAVSSWRNWRHCLKLLKKRE